MITCLYFLSKTALTAKLYTFNHDLFINRCFLSLFSTFTQHVEVYKFLFIFVQKRLLTIVQYFCK